MAERRALFIHANGNVDYNALDMRTYNAALLGGQNFQTLTSSEGSIGRGHGVLSSDALEVTAQTSPDDTVNVATGMVSVRGTQSDDQGVYICTLSAPETLTISSKDGTDTRTDYVVAQVRDAFYPDFTEDDWTPVVIAGTPGGGDPSLTNDCVTLAKITVVPGSGDTEITTTDIEDIRPQARATGGIHPVNARTDFPMPQEDDCIWEKSTERLLLYNGTSWDTIGLNLEDSWEEFGTSGSIFNNVTLGTGGDDYANHVKFGRTVVGVAGFELGTGGGVTGTISMNLPSTAIESDVIRYVGGVRASEASESPVPTWGAVGEVDPTTDPTILTNFATLGQDPWNSNTPFTWEEGDFFRCFFIYQEELT